MADDQFDALFGGTSEADAALEAEVKEFEAAQAPAEVAEEEVAAEPVAEDTSEPAAPPAAPAEPKEQVPLAVFLEAKSELKELRRQIEELKAPKQAEAPVQPAGPPVFQPTTTMDDDPATFLKEQNEYHQQLLQYHAEQIQQVRQWAIQQEQGRQQAYQQQSFDSAVMQAEEQFRSQAPDYDDALSFYRESKIRELRGMAEEAGVPFDESRTQHFIVNEFREIAQGAFRHGVNPAKVVYRMAKERGWNGTAKSSESNVERIERGVQASKSSQAVGGRTAAPASSGGSDFFKDLQRSAGYRT